MMGMSVLRRKKQNKVFVDGWKRLSYNKFTYLGKRKKEEYWMNMNMMMEMERFLESMGPALIVVGLAISGLLMSAGILDIAIRWCIFKKAGEKGWKAIIPFYGDYTYYKIAWSGRIYITLLLSTIGASILAALLAALENEAAASLISLIFMAVGGAYSITGMVIHFKIARAFGRPDYFAIGLYFFNRIFSAVLAFGDAEYVGHKTQKLHKEVRESRPAARPTTPPARPAEPRQPMYSEQKPASYAPAQQPTDYAYQSRAQYQPAAQQRPVRRAARNIDNQQ